MKTKEELAALKEEFDALNKKLAGLTEEELGSVSGGTYPGVDHEKDGDPHDGMRFYLS